MGKAKDLTELKSGRLVAIRPTDQRKRGFVVWECKCDCGNTTFVESELLTTGKKKSCGCLVDTGCIEGKRFGKLVAVFPTEGRSKRGSILWECKCDCGKTKLVSRRDLVSGYVRSCGCLRSEMAGLDLVGQRFGLLTVIRDTGERRYKEKIWECKCDCGNLVYVPTRKLTLDKKHSCGCGRRPRQTPLPPEIIGEQFGVLRAVRFVGEDKYWGKQVECQCSCGNVITVSARELMIGTATSCGCVDKKKRNEAENIAGQRFGKLVAIRPSEEQRSADMLWECRCDCGTTVNYSWKELINGKYKDCGCVFLAAKSYRKKKGNKKAPDLVGKKFGQLTVLRFIEGTGKKVECRCDCGNIVVLPARSIVGGSVKSCGKCVDRN